MFSGPGSGSGGHETAMSTGCRINSNIWARMAESILRDLTGPAEGSVLAS